MNTNIVNIMLHARLDTVYGGPNNPMLMVGMLPSLAVTLQYYNGYVSSTKYDAPTDAFGSGFPEQTTVYPLLWANAPYVGHMALKSKIFLYDQVMTNHGQGLVVYREEVWSLILEKAVQTVLPFLEERISKALEYMHNTLDSLVCLEDDNEEMVEYSIENRRFMHYLINDTSKMAESLTGTSWDDRIGILELYADLKYYTEMHRASHYQQTSTNEEWNRGALLLLRWYHSLGITDARAPLNGWRTWGGDTRYHNYEDHVRSIIQQAYREVLEEENKDVCLGSSELQNNISSFIQYQVSSFKDDLLISCFKQVQSLTMTVNKLCEKLQIAGQVLTF